MGGSCLKGRMLFSSEMSKSWDSSMVLMGCVNYFDYGNHCVMCI